MGRPSLDLAQFGDVEATGQAEDFLTSLDMCDRLPQIFAIRERSYELLAAGTGDPVVDVGCGGGTAAAELGARGVAGTGIDRSGRMVEVARRRHPKTPFVTGDAVRLPFVDHSMVGYRAERVYQHMADPAAAFADTIGSPLIGRQYRRLLLDAGFVGVEVEVRAVTYTEIAPVEVMLEQMARLGLATGIVTRQRADGWLSDLRERYSQGRGFLVIPVFLAAATAPDDHSGDHGGRRSG